jgi:hypothetical protein
MRCDRSSAQPLHASFRSHPADIILDTGQGIAVVGMQSILYWGRIPGYTSLFKLGIVHRLRLFSRGEPQPPYFLSHSTSHLRPANRSIASLHCHSRMPANHQLARTFSPLIHQLPTTRRREYRADIVIAIEDGIEDRQPLEIEGTSHVILPYLSL